MVVGAIFARFGKTLDVWHDIYLDLGLATIKSNSSYHVYSIIYNDICLNLLKSVVQPL